MIGTAFPDYIVGTGEAQTIYGGGGADVILGKGGGDEIFGGEEGDYCEATDATTLECEFGGGDKEVDTRDPATVRVGVMAPQEVSEPGLYVTGSSGADTIVASYSDPDGPTTVVAFTVNGSPAGSFTLDEPPDSVVLAGLDGGDTLAASGFPAVTSTILLGGSGEDELLGGETEDALVDGPGDDIVDAAGGDDAVPNNEGTDRPAAPAPPPVPPVDVVQPRPPRLKDRTAPRTGIAHRPRKRVFATARLRRVVFVFRSNERARFRCKLDRRRFRPCGSRRVYRLRPGRHALRVFAIDRAGNRDRSPALFKFRVQRR